MVFFTSTLSLKSVLLFLLCLSYALAQDENKYFHEPGEDDLHHHYDSRYFHGLLDEETTGRELQVMMRAYLQVFSELGLETWIAHGTLLGWFWNGRILPWDWDLDAQVTGHTLKLLGERHNMTYHKYYDTEYNISRKYVLDINPWSWERVRGDGANIIDARFINTSNGLFLDITGLSVTNASRPHMISCKNEHSYHRRQIFPLRESIFEGVTAKVPYAYARILSDEYAAESLSQTSFHDHHFDTQTHLWKKSSLSERELCEKEADCDVPEGGAFA